MCHSIDAIFFICANQTIAIECYMLECGDVTIVYFAFNLYSGILRCHWMCCESSIFLCMCCCCGCCWMHEYWNRRINCHFHCALKFNRLWYGIEMRCQKPNRNMNRNNSLCGFQEEFFQEKDKQRAENKRL